MMKEVQCGDGVREARVLNVGYGFPDWRAKLLSNFAPTPFELWGIRFASVEGFWQGLKYPEGSPEQLRVFGLAGYEARKAGRRAPRRDTFTWRGKVYRVGSREHWGLMREALRAKFGQNPEARRALLATAGLKLMHDLGPGRDSKTIPGRVFATMLEETREELLREEDVLCSRPS